jgi:polyisoprenyl-phosphate glycosyltransferase
MTTSGSHGMKAEEEVRLTVVVPCADEEASLPELFRVLIPVVDAATDGAWEILLVDDGSSDRTGELIRREHQRDARVRGVVLSRNFGHQSAIFAGLVYASGEFTGVMDADLQDPPEVLLQCYTKARDEGYDLVYGVRRRRRANPFLKSGYWLFYRLMRATADNAWPVDAGDFSVFNRKVLRLLLQLPEHVRVLRGLRSWVGLRQGFVAYDRPGREQGESKYSVVRLTGLAISALVSFSTLPLRLASLIGVGMSGLSLLLCVLVLLNRFIPQFSLFGFHIGANPGVTTIVILLLVLSSLGFLCLGILGEYLGVLLKEVKRRPLAIVRERIGVERSSRRGDLVMESLEPGEPARA